MSIAELRNEYHRCLCEKIIRCPLATAKAGDCSLTNRQMFGTMRLFRSGTRKKSLNSHYIRMGESPQVAQRLRSGV